MEKPLLKKDGENAETVNGRKKREGENIFIYFGRVDYNLLITFYFPILIFYIDKHSLHYIIVEAKLFDTELRKECWCVK